MIVKTKEQLNNIKTGCSINNECIHYLKDLVEPGITGLEVDQKATEFYKKKKVTPAFLHYKGYPAVINFMLNNQVIHCIPNSKQVVQEGDIVSIDTGCIYNGYYADQALSFGVGEMDEEDQRLIDTAKLSVEAGVAQCIVGNTIGDVGYAQESVIRMAGFNVVLEFVGHEIGKQIHDPVQFPGYGDKGTGRNLQENMLICVENQVCAGDSEVYIDKKDGWSTYTTDGSKAATFEQMIIIQKKKPIRLTSL